MLLKFLLILTRILFHWDDCRLCPLGWSKSTFFFPWWKKIEETLLSWSFSSVFLLSIFRWRDLFLLYPWSTRRTAVPPLLWLAPRWVCWCSISSAYLHTSFKVFSNWKRQTVIYLQMKIVAYRACSYFCFLGWKWLAFFFFNQLT